MSISYITNFKIQSALKNNFVFSFKNDKNIIVCKNFLIFLYLLNHQFGNNKNIKFFFKPKKFKLETLLRAPYRHKISRHQLTFSRYFFDVKFFFNINTSVNINNNQLIFLIKELKNYFIFFETNICFVHKYKISFFFKNSHFFKLMNYK